MSLALSPDDASELVDLAHRLAAAEQAVRDLEDERAALSDWIVAAARHPHDGALLLLRQRRQELDYGLCAARLTVNSLRLRQFDLAFSLGAPPRRADALARLRRFSRDPLTATVNRPAAAVAEAMTAPLRDQPTTGAEAARDGRQRHTVQVA